MPEGKGAFAQRHHAIECGTGQGGDNDLGPHHIHVHSPDFGRNAKPHSDDRRTEKFCDDRADQGEGRIDLYRVKNERQRRRQPSTSTDTRVVGWEGGRAYRSDHQRQSLGVRAVLGVRRMEPSPPFL